jgi:hypothetical protein
VFVYPRNGDRPGPNVPSSPQAGTGGAPMGFGGGFGGGFGRPQGFGASGP